MEFIFPGHNLTLIHPLGKWKQEESNNWKTLWYWFVTPDGIFLYFRLSKHIWHRFVKQDKSHRLYHFDIIELTEEPPGELHRATVESNDRGIQLLNLSTFQAQPEKETPMIKLGQYTIPSPPLAWTMEYLSSPPDIVEK